MMNLGMIIVSIIWLAIGIYSYYYVLDEEQRQKNSFLTFIVFLIITPPLIITKVIEGLFRNV